ncbi:hypothetical protein HMP0015_1505 [Acinetobacter haemolyticus ATCC 19194]|uniref:Uncharacterized protein n=1 Tax=Acinetobacter haemolyticus ATCC 19194 TaxID=707232 RepID=D4XP63_ACIHA|nr:hypothetical protein HMP0015_1505 [Acinetobacter haemolyticus ATCC 19194]
MNQNSAIHVTKNYCSAIYATYRLHKIDFLYHSFQHQSNQFI